MNRRQRGFTLIEILAAVGVLAGLIAVVSFSWSGNFRRLQKSRNLNKASSLLEQKMSELEVKYKSGNRVFPLEKEEGEFSEEPDYSWSYQTRPLTMPDVLTWLTAQGLPQNDMNISLTEALKNILSETVVELELTVHLKKSGKKYSLTSYFVNYDNAPALVESILSKFAAQNSGNL